MTTLYRLLLAAALAFALGLPAYVLVVRVHDTRAVRRSVECLERELAAGAATPAVAERCRIASVDPAGPEFWTSRDGRDEHRLADLRPGDTVALVAGFALFAGVPLALLLALRAAYRWYRRRKGQ